MKKKWLFSGASLFLLTPLLIIVSCANNSTASSGEQPSEQPGQSGSEPKPSSSEPTPKPPTGTDQPTIDLNPAGQTIANGKLKVSAYGELIADLNLFQSNTYLPEINDQLLNQTLEQNSKYTNWKLKILPNSSTATGQLFLELTNSKIANFSAQIEISGFETFTNPDKKVQLQYSNFQLNQKLWFEQLKPIQTSNNKQDIKNISSDDWIQLLNDFTIRATGTDQSVFGKKADLLAKHFQFEIKGTAQNNQINFRITTKFQNKKYFDNQWRDDALIQWNQISTNFNAANINLPIIDEVQQFVVDQTNVNQELLKEHYPSYFLGFQNFSKRIPLEFTNVPNLFQNLKLEDAAFKQYYFNNQELRLVVADNSIEANDLKNTLSFRAQLVIGNQKRNEKNFTFANQNKNLNQSEIFQQNNKIQIKSSGGLYNKLVQILKKEQNKVDTIFAGQSQAPIILDNIQTNQFINSNDILAKQWINFNNNPEQIQQHWNQIENQITPAIFSKPIVLSTEQVNELEGTNTLNIYTQWFQIEQEDAVVIEALLFDFPEDSVQINAKKINDQKIEISFQAATEILLSDQQSKSSPTTFWLDLTKQQWDDIKNK